MEMTHSSSSNVPGTQREDAWGPDVKLTSNAIAVLERRYLNKNDAGEIIESPQEMYVRVAQNIAQADGLFGVGLPSFNRSRKTIPGSPLVQAMSTMRSKTSVALSFPTTLRFRGLMRSYSPSFCRASMKPSVRPTEILKLVIALLSRLHMMKSSMSG